VRPNQLLQAFLKESSILKALKERGFRKSGSTFMRRAEGGAAHVVDFQVSRYSDSGSAKFTINFGVALEEVWQVYYGHGVGTRVNEADCFPRFRVGEVIGEFGERAKDVWWTFVEGAAPVDIGAEVKACLLDRCLPILDRLDSIESVFQFLREEAPLRHPAPSTMIDWAIVCHLHGDADQAESLLSELRSNSRLGDDWRVRIDDVRARLAGPPISE